MEDDVKVWVGWGDRAGFGEWGSFPEFALSSSVVAKSRICTKSGRSEEDFEVKEQ